MELAVLTKGQEHGKYAVARILIFFFSCNWFPNHLTGSFSHCLKLSSSWLYITIVGVLMPGYLYIGIISWEHYGVASSKVDF